MLCVARLRRVLNRTQLTLVRASHEFVDDRGHREAAQIGFFAVLSAVPLGMLLVGAFGTLPPTVDAPAIVERALAV